MEAKKPFDRTFKRTSNLDDMHENGAHDYLKFIKLGYGRGTDHANYEIREGRMTREKGLAMVNKYDHVKPSDLKRWLKYVGMEESKFDQIADTFRDQRVWRIKNNSWYKMNADGEFHEYGKVKGLPECKVNKNKSFTEDDIRPANLDAGKMKALYDDLDRLRNNLKSFVKVDCPACGSSKKIRIQ